MALWNTFLVKMRNFRRPFFALIFALIAPLFPATQAIALNSCAVTITKGGTPASSTDVVVSPSGIYCVAQFKTVATNYIFTVPNNITSVDYLVVGGGGGGGSGGGGAGGFLTRYGYTVNPNDTFTVAVGGGGAGGNGGNRVSPQPGGQGSPSSFGSIAALGGGGGGANDPIPVFGAARVEDGGSGGGSTFDCYPPQLTYSYKPNPLGNARYGCPGWAGGGWAGLGMPGQGNNGGSATYASYGAGGGGGGAGGAGFNTVASHQGGRGGIGLQSSITGTSLYYAGGGGGGVNDNNNAFDTNGGGAGGAGGGGTGSSYGFAGGGSQANATAGAANTGGGGGGTDPEDTNAAAGGSGVVILRWLSAASLQTITFNSNTSAPTTTTQSVTSAVGTALNPNTFTRTGYVFAGWTVAQDGTGTNYIDGANFTTSSNTTLYAQWQPGVTHTITFNGNGATGGTMAPQVGGGLSVLRANAFTKTGYTFSGWAVTVSGSTYNYADRAAYAFSTDATLTAQWVAVGTSYTVTFYSNGADGGGTLSQTSSTATPLNYNGFSYTGKSFLGWTTTYGSSTVVYQDGQIYPFTSSTSLYAIWVAQSSQKVMYNSNGGTGSMTDQTASLSTQISSNTFARTNFQFLNWNTAANGTGVTYQSNYMYSFASTITLYAQWAQNITVSYDTNTATSGTAPASFSSYANAPGVQVAYNSGNMAKTGYILTGWNTQRNGGLTTGVALAQTNVNFTANTTLYAQWAPATYTIIYAPNCSTSISGSVPASQSYLYGNPGITIATNSSPLGCSGYTFNNWNTNPDGTGTSFAAGATNATFAQDTSLFAQWTRVLTPQTITFAALPRALVTTSTATLGVTTGYALATASSGLTPTYSTTSTACTVSSAGVIRILTVGTCGVTASQAGNTIYAAAPSVTQNLVIAPDVPGAPFINSVSTSGSAASGPAGSATVQFTDNTNHGATIESYTVTATNGGTTLTQVIVAGPGTNSGTISGLTIGLAYTISVLATNSAGSSPATTYGVTVTPAYAPYAVTNMVSTQSAAGSLLVNFTPPASLNGGTATIYQYFITPHGSAFPTSPTYATSPASGSTIPADPGYIFTGLNNATSYDIQVIVATTGNGAPLSQATALLNQNSATAPNRPLLALTQTDSQTVTATWFATGDNGNAITTFTPYIKVNGTQQSCTFAFNPNTGICAISGLAGGQIVTGTVYATDGLGLSSILSETQTATVIGVVGAPMNLVATAGDGQASIAFTENFNGDTLTYYQYSLDGSTYSVLSSLTSPVVIPGLTNGTTYSIFLLAVGNFNGSGPVSAQVTVTPVAPPTPPAVTPPAVTPPSVPVPDPVQQSSITAIEPSSSPVGRATPVVISGTFVEKIVAVQINGVNMVLGSWSQTPTSITLTMPVSSVGSYTIQLFNGSVPVLSSVYFEYTMQIPEPAPIPVVAPKPAPSPSPTATHAPVITPKPSPTPTPTQNVQPTLEMKKIANFHFATNSYVVTESAKAAIYLIVSRIIGSPYKAVLIYGNTDARGGVDNNLLSKNRAIAVRAIMKPLLPGKTIQLGWFAATKPLVSGKNASAYAQNRRVEIWVK